MREKVPGVQPPFFSKNSSLVVLCLRAMERMTPLALPLRVRRRQADAPVSPSAWSDKFSELFMDKLFFIQGSMYPNSIYFGPKVPI